MLEPDTDLDRVVRKGGGLEASPHGRLERLLRATRAPAGLHLRRPHDPPALRAARGESSGWMDFQVRDMLPTAGRPLVAAMRLLLRESRLLTGPAEHRLAGLLEASRRYQNVVSERLSEQVLHGLHELLRGFEQAHLKSQGSLLARELEQDPDRVYRALLTVILRLVFLLFAEERGMLTGDPTFAAHYSVVGLHERLRRDAGLWPDTMDDRYGAWAQLLALFRMVHDGTKSGKMHLPGRRGALFSPSRFPFLEGWPGSGAPQVTQAVEPPLVPDGTIHRVLEKLLVLDGERISYRALDVEQIGSVYETMMGFRLQRATGLSVAVKSPKTGGAPATIDLEKLAAVAPGSRVKWFRDRTGRDLKKVKTVEGPLKSAKSVTELHAALAKVVDHAATPDLVPRGAMILQPSDERRSSGSHYTPRELTAPIVEETLRPVLDRLAGGAVPLERRAAVAAEGQPVPGRLAGTAVPRPAELLELKVCDPAMGSGAFLVETCRQLAERLLDSWKLHGGRPEVPEGEDEIVFARRLVAQRCLYGVDRNPMAVDLAKMSLWLATLAKNEPLTFLDHALRDGDSLVGLDRRQIAGFSWERGPVQTELAVNNAVKRVAELRRRIRRAGPGALPVEMEDLWGKARAALAEVRFYGDLAVESFLLETKIAARRKLRLARLAEVQAGETMAHRERLAGRRREHPPLAPFHWQVEFPEVFERENPGFDAFVGNPPFAGKNTAAAANVPNYRVWLQALHAESHGNADLVAHFFRRSFDLLRYGGTFGFIATNTIGQGDTRSTGLRWICNNGGGIYRATTRYRWPGPAAVIVSIVHAAKNAGGREITSVPIEIDSHDRPGSQSLQDRNTLPSRCLLDGREVDEITAFLVHTGGHEDPERLRANAGKSFVGSYVLGMGFTFDDRGRKADDAPESGGAGGADVTGVPSPLSEKERLIAGNPRNREAIFPYIGGSEVNKSPTHGHHRYVINFRDYPLRRADPGSAAPGRRGAAAQNGRALGDSPVESATGDPNSPHLSGSRLGLGVVRSAVRRAPPSRRSPARGSLQVDDRQEPGSTPEGTAISWHGASDKQRKEWRRSGIVPHDYPDPVAADWPELLAIVEERVRPARAKLGDNGDARQRKEKWWLWGRYTPGLFSTIADLDRVLAISRVGHNAAVAFLPGEMVYAESIVVFPLKTDAAFCALQSRPHELWARFFGSSMKDDLRYTPSDCFETFPFPEQWETHSDLEVAGAAYHGFRADLMLRNDEGLTKTYNRFHDREKQSSGITRLRELHAAMDRAVLDAYGWTDIPTACKFFPEHSEDPAGEDASGGSKRYRYRWPDPVRNEVLGRLIALNAQRAKEERREAVQT